MPGINDVTLSQIETLSDIQLSMLLHKLLHCEATNYIPGHFTVSVPLNITTGDGGSDGLAAWNNGPASTPKLTSRYNIFQNKATTLFPGDCYEEILQKKEKRKPRKLKSEIEKVVTAGGSYILFTNIAIVDKGKTDRTEKFRLAIKDAGHANHASFLIDVYDANTIKDWTNQYLSAVLLVQSFNSMTRPLGFRTWEELGPDIKERDTPYQLIAELTDAMDAIRTNIMDEKIFRIHGHSGLGKTRFLYETFRPATQVVEGLKNIMVYYDVELTEKLTDVIEYIISHREKHNGIIVVDNCDTVSHRKLSHVIKSQGNLRLITIGLDDDTTIEDRKIKLIRDNQRDLVRNIITGKLATTHTTSDIEYLNSVCEGYPWMAVRFSDQAKRLGIDKLHTYSIEELIQKLLFEHTSANNLEYNVIRACSVFSSFGFLDNSFQSLINKDLAKTLQEQMDFIRTEIYDGTITDSDFREICDIYKIIVVRLKSV